MKSTDKLTPAEAVKLAEEYEVSATTETIYQWCRKYKIGKKVVGRWQVNKKRLKLLLEGTVWQDTQEEK